MKYALLFAVSLCACQPAAFGVREVTVTHALTEVASCEDARHLIGKRAAAEANRSIDRHVQAELTARARNRLSHPLSAGCSTSGVSFGVSSRGGSSWGGPMMVSAPSASSSGGGATAQIASDYTGTNNQVGGVDEADIIKNDGNYVYILANGQLQIIDAWPVPSTHRVSTTAIEGDARSLFIIGDRALVFASVSDLCVAPTYYGSECTYGYDCDFRGDGRASRISLFDISDRASPKFLEQLDFDGSYVTARAIGNAIHMVASYSQLPQMREAKLQFYLGYDLLKETCVDDAALIAAADKVKALNETLASQINGLPRLTTKKANGSAPVTRDACEHMSASTAPDNGDVATIISFDVTQGFSSVSLASAIARPGPIYASQGSLYIASRYGNEGSVAWRDSSGSTEFSTLHRFSLDGPSAKYMASGGIAGRVLNQFAMDEHEGHLRVASSIGHAGSGGHSLLTVLDTSLVFEGMVSGLGPNEDIRSVRFDGDRAFVVTFEKTDPLFYIDLSQPSAPRVAGELKIPGFSTYMHMLDGSHLLTIGYDADDQGSFSWFRGVMLQIFDVSKAATPILMHKEVIGTRGSTSDALTNHLAFTYFPSRKLLALPMTICDGNTGSTYGEMSFSGLLVYDVSLSTGFSRRGGLAFNQELQGNACSNWWSNADSTVNRSIFMEDYVLGFSGTELRASNVANVELAVAALSLDIGPGPQCARQ